MDALADHSPRPGSVWNRIPDARRDDLIEFALEHEALSTRELAVKYTDEKRYFISESSAYRILKAADLITAPDYVVIKAADEFNDKTTAINEMWQTDFTYFKIIGWGWYYLSIRPLSSDQWRTRLILGRRQPLHHCMEALHEHAR